MITKTLKTTSGPLKISIPSDRSEITLGMLIDLTPPPGEAFSELEQLSILSGVQYKGDEETLTLMDLTDMDELAVFDETLQKLAYQLRAFSEVEKIPTELTLIMPHNYPASGRFKRWFNSPNKGKVIQVISNLWIAPAGAYMEAKEVISADMKEWQEQNPQAKDLSDYKPKPESYLHILSLYFYCPATGEKFNSARAAAFQSVVRKCLIDDVLPIARHFFLKYPNLSKPKVKH